MKWRRAASLVAISILLGLIGIIALNSSLGVDADETYTDAHRPAIVGEDRASTP